MWYAGSEVVNQVGPEAVAPLCAGVVACGMWHVGRGISGRAAVDDGMQRFSRDGGLANVQIHFQACLAVQRPVSVS